MIVLPDQWREKGEKLLTPKDHAFYDAPRDQMSGSNAVKSTAPTINDPLTTHKLSYLNGGGGSGKTTRAINLFSCLGKKLLILTPTHRLAKEMKARNVKAQTCHSFLRWSGCASADWTPERMGQKKVPKVIIWDEICTVPRPILQIFLEWLDQKKVQVVCCGDQGQPPPTAGESSHDWLCGHATYYKEVLQDYRAKDEALESLKKAIRLKSDEVQCLEMRKALPSCLSWELFESQWQPNDLILTSRKAVHDVAKKDYSKGTKVTSRCPRPSPLPSQGQQKTKHPSNNSWDNKARSACPQRHR